ncbi:Serine-threonine/tyrosine-protein kinase, catalytic domain, partial [Dillenia turbinata]
PLRGDLEINDIDNRNQAKITQFLLSTESVSVSADKSAFTSPDNGILDCYSSTETQSSVRQAWIPYYRSKVELSSKVASKTTISDPRRPKFPKIGVCIFVNKYTLMRTTASSFPVKASYIIKEYCVIVDGELLNITFTPSPNFPGAYGFINRIEVVSMPENLYLRTINVFPNPMNSSTALEIVYQVNVGGFSVSPDHSTGFSRPWTGDYGYLIAGEFSFILYSEVYINYSSTVAAYYVPKEVYATARIAGRKQNGSRSLYWSFPVDSGFHYLVRLHFCEIMSSITNNHQRVFSIFINGQIADDQADVMQWSHDQRVPVYRDYAVNCTGTEDLSIVIQSVTDSKYAAILNGLEILKFSDVKNNLAGPNPFKVASTQDHETSFSSYRIPLLVMTCAFISLFCVLVVWLIHLHYCYASKWQSRNPILWPSSEQFRCFSLLELRLATDNFSNNCLLGEGGFGKVYEGSINGGSAKVAVKRGNPGSNQGVNEFHTEITMLSKLRHSNLVSLIGYCMEDAELILVYDFMAQGTVRDHLYNTCKPPVPWKKSGTIDQIIDPIIAGTIAPECLKTFTGIARKCLADKGSERPTMSNVIWNLELAWQQQQLQECGEMAGTNWNHAIQMSVMIDGQHHYWNNNSDPTPGAEFSELTVPTGR